MKIYILCLLIYFSLEYDSLPQIIQFDNEFPLKSNNIIIKGDDIDKDDTVILEIGNACGQNFNVEYNIRDVDDDDDDYDDYYHIFDPSINAFLPLTKKKENNRNGICICTYEIKMYADEDTILVRLTLSDLRNRTIKAYKRSYLWVVFVIIGALILIAAIAVGIYFFMKKKSNKSIINEPLSPEEEPVFKPSEENSNW